MSRTMHAYYGCDINAGCYIISTDTRVRTSCGTASHISSNAAFHKSVFINFVLEMGHCVSLV